MNKTLKYLLFLLGISSIFSCRKDTAKATHNLEYPMQFTIQTGANPVLTHVYSWNVASNWDNFLVQNNLTAEQVTAIKPVSLHITTIFNTPINYDFIEEAKVKIYNPQDITYKLPIGEIYNIPNNKVEDFYLIPDLAEIKEFVSIPSFKIDLNLRYREIIRTNTDHRLFIKFDVFTQ